MKERVSGRWFARIQAKPQNWFGCLRRDGLLSKRYMLYPSFSCNARISKFFGPRNILQESFCIGCTWIRDKLWDGPRNLRQEKSLA